VDRVLRCDCGFEARAQDEQGLVEEVRRHAWEAHGMALSCDEALVLAVRAELDPVRVVESGLPREEET
jgi:predicted small metal-binding protein